MHGSLATRLRVLRAERGLTVRQVAALSGVAKETISQIERGERHPYDRTLAKLAQAYGVPVEGLIEEPALAGSPGKAPAPQSGQPEDEAPSRSAPPPSVSWARLQEHFENVRPDEVEYINEMLSEFWRVALPDEKPQAHFVPEDVDGQRVWRMVQQALEEGNVFAPEEAQRLTQGAIKRAVLAGQAG
jgi:transcriptional regulator with XRE-family HTH domain